MESKTKTYSVRVNKTDNIQAIKRKLSALEEKILQTIEPNYSDYSQLGEIAQQIVEEQIANLKNRRLHYVLSHDPISESWDGSCGESENTLDVKVNLKNGESIELAYTYRYGSNYAHSQTREGADGDKELINLAGESTLTQLAYLHKKLNQSFEVIARHSYLNDWTGQEYHRDEFTIIFKFPSLEVTYSSP